MPLSCTRRAALALLATGCGRTPLDVFDGSIESETAAEPRVCPPVIQSRGEPATIVRRAVLEGALDDAAGLVVTGLGDRVIIGVEDVPTQAVFAYRTADATFEALSLDGANPWCACGFGGTPVGVGARLYTFGNEGWSFDGRTWAPAPYPRAFRRGEAATTAHEDTIVMIGGRGFDDHDAEIVTDTFSVFDPATDTWTTVDAPSPFGPILHGTAASVGERLFLVAPGGILSIAAWDGHAWTHRPSAAVPASRPRAIGYAGLVFVVERPFVLTFDPSADAWTEPVTLPDGKDWGLAEAGCGLWLVGRENDDVVVYEIELSS